MRADERAQRLLEDKAGFYRDGRLGFCLARVVDVKRYGLPEGTLAALYPAPAEVERLIRMRHPCKAYDVQEVIFIGEKSPIGGVITKHIGIGTYKISFPSVKRLFRVEFDSLIELNTEDIQPLPSSPAPSNSQLRKAGRALTDEEEPRLAVIKEVYSFRGLGLTILDNAFSFLYKIPKRATPKDLMQIPEKDLEYLTTCTCRTRFLRLID